MTPEEWDRYANPTPMLAFLQSRGGMSDRKLRLFACACCRRVWQLLPDDANRDLVAAVEDRLDGTRDDAKLWDAIVASSRREGECRDHAAYWAAKYLGRGFYKLSPLDSAVVVALRAAESVPQGTRRQAERATQAALARCIFGDPFRPAQGDPAWLAWHAGAIPALAQAVYEERELPSGHLDAARLAILADMLEEAGATDPHLLGHLRSPGPHVRGCFAVDVLTGRS
jgi:hypothetical protein